MDDNTVLYFTMAILGVLSATVVYSSIQESSRCPPDGYLLGRVTLNGQIIRQAEEGKLKMK